MSVEVNAIEMGKSTGSYLKRAVETAASYIDWAMETGESYLDGAVEAVGDFVDGVQWTSKNMLILGTLGLALMLGGPVGCGGSSRPANNTVVEYIEVLPHQRPLLSNMDIDHNESVFKMKVRVTHPDGTRSIEERTVDRKTMEKYPVGSTYP